MTEIPVDEPGTPTGSRYSSDADVRLALGKFGNRLPTEVDVAAHGSMAHADVVDALSAAYPSGIPSFGGVGLEVVRWAEAKVAAASILAIVHASFPELADAPARMRADALATLSNGVAGYPAGSVTDPDDPTSPTPYAPSPRVSSFTPVSAFPDPYEDVRGLGIANL